MTGNLTKYAENKLLDHLFGIAEYTRPATLYLALCTADPGETATGSSIEEPTGGDYARAECDSWDAAADRATANSADIDFPEPGADWDLLTHWAICDATTAGNVLAYGPLVSPVMVVTGDPVSILAGDLDISIDAANAESGMSDTLADAMLDHLFADVPYTQPEVWLAACIAPPVDSDTGSTISEPPGAFWERTPGTGWNAATLGVVTNGTTITLMGIAATAVTITHLAICDADTAGNLLVFGPLTSAVNIGAGEAGQFATESLHIGLD
jgi:hypothetical protein